MVQDGTFQKFSFVARLPTKSRVSDFISYRCNLHMSMAIKIAGVYIVFSGHYCAIACKLFILKKDECGHVDDLLATKHLACNGRLTFT